jgi:TolB protein
MKRILIGSLMLIITLGATLSLIAQENEQSGKITVTVDPKKTVPVYISGFSGEVDRTLRFDLEVMGCVVVSESEAMFTVTGNYKDQLNGYLLSSKSKQQVFAKGYRNNSARAATHAFADDVIFAIFGVKGIAQGSIVYKLDTGANSELFVSDYDGHNAVQATHDNSIVAAPCWVQGRRMLYYNSYKSGYPDIYSHDLATGQRKVIAKFSGSNISPDVSRDGRVAMILSKGGSPNLYVANADGSGLKQLTKSREGEACPAWSPDGSKICFVSRISGRAFLYTISVTGGPMTRLRTEGVPNATEPDWSPDGKTIAFTAQMGSFHICTVPATGGAVEILTPGADPSWAPNSRTIVFTKNHGAGKRSLSLLDVNTKRVKDGAQISGSASQPAWAR